MSTVAGQGESIGKWLRIEQVTPWAGNPRVHPKRSIDAVAASIKRFGFVQAICVWTSKMEVVAGHNRLKAMGKLLSEDPEFIPKNGFGPGLVKVTFQEFDNEDEAHAYAVADNKTAELSEWEEDGLREMVADWSARKVTLDGLGYDEAELKALIAGGVGSGDGDGADPSYARNVESPIYTPKGDEPPISALCEESRTQTLLSEIEAADIPEDQKQFLRLAAYRHNVFDYENIAEFYAHASKPMQELMENSALVIIDFNKAIEHGFVKLSQELAEAYKNDQQG